MAKLKDINLILRDSKGIVVEEKTDDVLTSLQKYKPLFIKNKLQLEVSKGDRKYERVLFVPFARRLFYNSLTLEVLSRNITRALNG